MRRILLSLAAASLMSACGGGGSDTPTPPAGTPGITLSASSSSGTIARGTSGTTTLSLGRVDGFAGAVSLAAEGAPSGVTVQFAPQSLTGSATTSTATISVSATATPGTATITLRASGSGVTDKTVQFALTVPTPAITVSAGSGTATAVQGASVTVPITITRINGAAGAVTLTAEGLPANVTAAFSPAPIPDGSTTSTLTLTVGASATATTSAIVVRAASTGVSDQTATIQLTVTSSATPAYTITAAPAALAVVAGQSGQSVLTITKTGGFTANVALALEGAPSGVTGSFAPNPATGTASTLSITTTTAVTPGTYNLTVRGTAAGLTDRTIVVALTVTIPSGFSLAATGASVAQGSTGTSTVTITRTGAFAGAVDLTASGLPANVTATFTPASVAGTTSTLTFTAGAGATPGSYSVAVNGTGAGVAAQSATVALTVTTGGGGGGNIAWRFCDAARVPLWFAYRNGTAGAWTRVAPSGDNTFSFTLTANTGSVAYVLNRPGGGGTDGTIYLQTAAEFAGIAAAECTANPTSTGTKALSGTFAGLTLLQAGSVAFSGGVNFTSQFPTVAWAIPNVPNRVVDLFAARSTFNITTGTINPDRGVIRRNVNYAANAVVPVIDFAGAESFAFATATATLANIGGDQSFVVTSFLTANGTAGQFTPVLGNVGGALTVFGLPSALTQAGDFHQVLATAANGDGSSGRLLFQYNRDLTNRTYTFGGTLTLPTVTTTGTAPYARLKVKSAWQAEYGDAGATSMTQSSGLIRSWTISGSRGYFGSGSSEYEFELQDFSGVTGFSNAWGLLAGSPVTVSTTLLGPISGAINSIAEGSSWKAAFRVQTQTP